MALSGEAIELLKRAHDYGVTSVYAGDIIPAASLIVAGYVEAHDDYEGPWISVTDRGRSSPHLNHSVDGE